MAHDPWVAGMGKHGHGYRYAQKYLWATHAIAYLKWITSDDSQNNMNDGEQTAGGFATGGAKYYIHVLYPCTNVRGNNMYHLN
jgi:hypothetical protein